MSDFRIKLATAAWLLFLVLAATLGMSGLGWACGDQPLRDGGLICAILFAPLVCAWGFGFALSDEPADGHQWGDR